MTKSAADVSMALFCDFENIALGVRDAQYEKFDIKPVLERLLLKGSIVVKKAYCDWDRYKSFKAVMHEANFELIEIPHVRQSGKNSADIRMVVDALDLCYTKSHVDTFVIISGDSDFSPLVSKLRENAKRVIGIGVKQSTSDLLIANCDEFIYIDDLMRKRQREDKQPRKPVEPQEMEARRAKGLELAAATLEALLEDRADDEKVWASVVKEALKRRHPGFNENYHGFKTFGALLEEAHKRGLLEFGRDNNNAYAKRRAAGTLSPMAETSSAPVAVAQSVEAATESVTVGAVMPAPSIAEPPLPVGAPPAKRRARGRKPKVVEPVADVASAPAPLPELVVPAHPAVEKLESAVIGSKPPRKPRGVRKPRKAAGVE